MTRNESPPNSRKLQRKFAMISLREQLSSYFPQKTKSPAASLIVLSFLLILNASPPSVDANSCIVNGTYIHISNSGLNVSATILNTPENGTLQDVGDKKCGFRINGTIADPQSINNVSIEYTAVEIESEVDQFCSFWANHSICVCPFYGCNSLTGVFYETLFKSINNTGQVKGENYTTNATLDDAAKRKAIEYLLFRVESAYYNTTQEHSHAEPQHFQSNHSDFEDFKKNNSWMFPNETRKQDLIRQGSARIQPSTVASLAAGKSSEPKPNDSNLVIWVVTGVVLVLLLVAGTVVALIICRKKAKKPVAPVVKKEPEVEKNELSSTKKDSDKKVESEASNNESASSELLIKPMSYKSDVRTGTTESCKTEGNFRPLGKHDHVNLNSEAYRKS